MNPKLRGLLRPIFYVKLNTFDMKTQLTNPIAVGVMQGALSGKKNEPTP